MKDIWKGIKVYIVDYFVKNLAKKLPIFLAICYIAGSFSVKFLMLFLLFYLNYLAVYFFNDYIDREEDLKRQYIDLYKLFFSNRTLLYLGIIHLLLPAVFLAFFRVELGLLSLFIVLLGILRSFIRNRVIREVSLGLLQLLQLFLFSLIIGESILFIEHLFTFIQFAWAYSVSYYIQKLPIYGENKIKTSVYLAIFTILTVLAIPEATNPILYFYLILSIAAIGYLYWSYRKVKSNYDFSKNANISVLGMYFISLILFMLIFGNIHMKSCCSVDVMKNDEVFGTIYKVDYQLKKMLTNYFRTG